MPIVPRASFRKKSSTSSKEHALPSGKENECPTTSAIKNRKVIAPRRRVSLRLNDDRKKELGQVNARSCQPTSALAIAECFSSKKTQFHIHCDEKDVPQPRRGSTAKPAGSGHLVPSGSGLAKRPEPTLPSEKMREPLRKRSSKVTARVNGKLLPSKIPRRVSTVANIERKTRNDQTVTLKQVESLLGKIERAVSNENRNKLDEINEESIVVIECPKSTSTPKEPELSPIPAPIHLREACPETTSQRRNLAGSEFHEQQAAPSRKPSKLRPPLAPELICHAHYHENLPDVEREREELAPRLSNDFLKEYINAEQRALVVAFMLHLGTHCRYSSSIVYQAVKLFDVAIDRLKVQTTFVQLTALASLWIALKAQEVFHKIPSASTMISLAKDLYAGREDLLIRFEKTILQALDFRIFFADVHSLFAYHLINYKRCSDVSSETFEFLYHAGGYVIDLTLVDEQFCRTAVSLIALTAAELVIGIVLDTVNGTDEPSKCPRWLFWRGLLYAAGSRLDNRFQDEDIDRCRVSLLRCVLMSRRKNCRFEMVYRKYSRSRYGRIAEPFLDRAIMLLPFESFSP